MSMPDRSAAEPCPPASPLGTPPVCCAVVGTVWDRWNMCGNPTKAVDANGRPVCGIHKKGQPGIEWRGYAHRYPHGAGPGAVFKTQKARRTFDLWVCGRNGSDAGAPGATSAEVGQ